MQGREKLTTLFQNSTLSSQSSIFLNSFEQHLLSGSKALVWYLLTKNFRLHSELLGANSSPMTSNQAESHSAKHTMTRTMLKRVHGCTFHIFLVLDSSLSQFEK